MSEKSKVIAFPKKEAEQPIYGDLKETLYVVGDIQKRNLKKSLKELTKFYGLILVGQLSIVTALIIADKYLKK